MSMIQTFNFYIGIDSSSTHTAIVVLNDKGGLLSYSLIEPVSSDLRMRGKTIYTEVMKIVNSYDHLKTKVIIESPAFMARGKVVDLAMIVGGLYYGISTYYKVDLVPPTTLKKFFTGSGKAKKEEMIDKCPKYLVDIFSRKYKKIDDLVDAYALALYGMLN